MSSVSSLNSENSEKIYAYKYNYYAQAVFNLNPKDLIYHRLLDNTHLLDSEPDSDEDAFEILYPFLRESQILAHFQIENMKFFLCKCQTVSKGILPPMELTYIRAIKRLSTGVFLESITRINMEDVYESNFAQLGNFDVSILYEPLTAVQMKQKANKNALIEIPGDFNSNNYCRVSIFG